MNMFKKNGGFTLVELIVVIAILAILAGIAIPAYSGYITKAKDAGVTTELSAIATAAMGACAETGTVEKIVVAPNGTITITASTGATVDQTDFKLFYGSESMNNAAKLAETSYKNGATWYAADPDGDGALTAGWNKN